MVSEIPIVSVFGYFPFPLLSLLTMNTYINVIVKSTYTHLIQLCKIRKYLPSKTVVENSCKQLYSSILLYTFNSLYSVSYRVQGTLIVNRV